MSKALTTDAIITSASTRADGSLSFRVSTPELSSEEKVALIDLAQKPLRLLIQPLDGQPEAMVEVKGKLAEKTPSQRLRAVIWHWWKQGGAGEVTSFEPFYQSKVEGLIEQVKSKLNPE